MTFSHILNKFQASSVFSKNIFADKNTRLHNECNAKISGPCDLEEVQEIFPDESQEQIEKRWLNQYHTCKGHRCSKKGTIKKEERPFYSCRCICKFGYAGAKCNHEVDIVELYKTVGIDIEDPSVDDKSPDNELNDFEKGTPPDVKGKENDDEVDLFDDDENQTDD